MKISMSCTTTKEHEGITGNMLKDQMARDVNLKLLDDSQTIIGRQELRSILGFAPPGVWRTRKPPSEEEIAGAGTVEAYYELKEPLSCHQDSDEDVFLPEQFPPAIAFLDARFPGIREMYRRELREKFQDIESKSPIDRKGVDYMIEMFYNVHSNVRFATLAAALHQC
ncbi:hypothetical protein CRE_29316 [Caenorhabditis remanei]|uniref:Uncharacterized protein n=1 Tax=Caenorhabditis remanei TaxID=31234 RepID=E3MY37_CAERE|nr:hypothetical protein CRE_29316 [Caenorhabditis remanei]